MMPSKKSDPQESRKILLIDGYGFVFRAYHSMPPLTRPDGTPVGAVYGFTNMLIKFLEQHEFDHVAVVLDSGSKTFRNEIYSDYKANRPPCPEDLSPQFPIIRQAAQALNLSVVEQKGYEADDLIATYARIAKEAGDKVVIASSDKDLMQLVGDGIEMFDPMKSKPIGVEQVKEKFGVLPDKVLDVLSLMGDSSDNVPGVPGIGPKTAALLIEQFGSLDGVLDRAEEIKQNKRRQSLQENADMARISRDLIRLCDEVPLKLSIEDFAVKEVNSNELYNFLKEQGFNAIINRVEKRFNLKDVSQSGNDNSKINTSDVGNIKPVKKVKTNYKIYENIDDLVNWLNEFYEIRTLAIETIYDKKSVIFGVSVAIDEANCTLLKFDGDSKKAAQSSLFGDEENSKECIKLSDVLSSLKVFLEDLSIIKLGCDIKSLLKECIKLKINLSAYDDISLMSYSISAGKNGHKFDDMASAYLVEDYEQVKNLNALEDSEIANILCKRAGGIIALYEQLSQRLFDENMNSLYARFEKPLINVLANMELNGIKVDPVILQNLSKDFEAGISNFEREIYKKAGYEFNIGSPKQLGEALFDKMELPSGKKSKKTGAYSTGAETLEELAVKGFDIASDILNWRQLSKLKTTYTDALIKQIASDARIHTNFAMTATTTGRLSSNDPNLQNIPIRSEEGNKIRGAFVADAGNKLISADYSQIELRLLAHVANIEPLKDAFSKGYDIHTATASQVFGVPLDEVGSDLRRKAKTINFGIIYGISAFGLASRLGISRSDAANYIDSYFARYPGIRKYMDETIMFAKEHGYVQTLWGRKCYLKDINNKNHALRQFSERAAINAPLQGSAADIIKKAMIYLHKNLEKFDGKAKLLLQVHDELIVEAPENLSQEISQIIKNTMEQVANLSVPLLVDVSYGDNWREIH
ncbi:DNA polymerase I [Rickettsiales bacterium]|nr:DNA polymerase I [Rickettsiales bacterium]